MKLKAYAKVNLILKVLGKLDNGYHNLQMLNTKIDIFDEINIEKSNMEFDELYFKNANLNSEKDNLVLKCLKLVKDIYKIKDNFKITITKNIPIGAGLGGGSSDAATIIRYILDKYKIEREDTLIKKLSQLGADIPFFLYDGVCIVEGIGEIVTESKIIIPSEFVVINPNIYISTKEVFNSNQKQSIRFQHNELIEYIEKNGYYAFMNDLEESCFSLNYRMKELKEKLNEIAYSVMSGSGSTMLLFGSDVNDIYKKCCELYPEYYIKKVKIL